MTLGIAVKIGNQILMGIDSKGVPVPCDSRNRRSQNVRSVFCSKLLFLQRDPDIVVLCAGGTEHWADVKDDFQRQPTLLKTRDRVIEILYPYTRDGGQAFGLLCGFDGNTPRCFRIDGSDASSFEEELSEGRAICIGYLPETPPNVVGGMDSLLSLIQSSILNHPHCYSSPIVSHIIRSPS